MSDAIDPTKTAEAASGRVDWDHTFTILGDQGEEIKLPYLSPSFGELRKLARLGSVADNDETMETLTQFMVRRLGTELFARVEMVLSVDDLQNYAKFCQGTSKGGSEKKQTSLSYSPAYICEILPLIGTTPRQIK